MLERLKNKGVLLGILSQIIIVFTLLGLFDKIGLSETAFKAVVVAICEIGVLIGFINNPTDPNRL